MRHASRNLTFGMVTAANVGSRHMGIKFIVRGHRGIDRNQPSCDRIIWSKAGQTQPPALKSLSSQQVCNFHRHVRTSFKEHLMQMSLRLTLRVCHLVLFTLIGTGSAMAQIESHTEGASAQVKTDQPLNISSEQARESIQWLASKASMHLPKTISGDKNWGDTKRVWAGVKIRVDGFKLKTNRRFRELEQGRWIKYDVSMPDVPPTIEISKVIPLIAKATGQQSWLIDSSIVAPMKFTARIQRWNLGVKLFSVTITGEIRVRLNSTMSVGFHANFGEIPPGLVIDPNVKTAILVMEHFKVDRVSKIGGDVAEQWGEVMEELLVERLIHRQNKKIVAQLNKSIDKERDDLELSLSEWFDRLSKPSDSNEAQQLQAPQLQAPQLQAPQLQAPAN